MSAMAMNPYLEAGSEGLGLITDIIGLIMQKQAMDEARSDAKGIDFQNRVYQESRDKVSDKISNANLKIAQDQNQIAKNRFALDATNTGYAISKDQAQKVIDLLNSNNTLRDRVLRNWSI